MWGLHACSPQPPTHSGPGAIPPTASETRGLPGGPEIPRGPFPIFWGGSGHGRRPGSLQRETSFLGEGGGIRGSTSPGAQVQQATASSLPGGLRCHWPSMQAFLQATAEIRAAPRPLPSSDSMKVISQLGVSRRTLAWNLSLKLTREAGLPFLPLHWQTRPRPAAAGAVSPGGSRGQPWGRQRACFRSPSARGTRGAVGPTAGLTWGAACTPSRPRPR